MRILLKLKDHSLFLGYACSHLWRNYGNINFLANSNIKRPVYTMRFFLTIVILTCAIVCTWRKSCSWLVGNCCKLTTALLSLNHMHQDDEENLKNADGPLLRISIPGMYEVYVTMKDHIPISSFGILHWLFSNEVTIVCR